ncbi:MAG: DUF4013 domain-containing protein [Chloroflexia bacterium]|nr:DUF4013 domain-containing protein [Chloroflexia bacterium]
MNVGRAFKFVFDDPRWLLKLFIGGLFAVAAGFLNFIPILGQVVAFAGGLVVTGYSLILVRRVMDGYDTPLPEWDDIGGLLTFGLKGFVVQLGWSLPLIVLGLAVLLPGIVVENSGLIALGALAVLVLALATLLIAPAGLGRLAATGSIGEGLNIRLILEMVRNNLGDYVLLALAAVGALLIGVAGFLIFVVGGLLTFPYALLVIAHLTGQAYFRSTSTLPAPAVAAAAERPYLEP